MSEESKFLKYQDKNGNKVPDVCPDLPFVPGAKKCPDCTPNEGYVAPAWRDQNVESPWFNEKKCRFYVTVVTEETSIVPGSTSRDIDWTSSQSEEEYMEALFESYQYEAVTALLLRYEKEDSDKSRDIIVDNIKFNTFDLDTAPAARLKLLYSVPYEDFAPLPEREGPEDEDDSDDEETEGNPITVTYNTNKMYAKIRMVQATLWLFARHYRVASFVEKSSIVFSESGKLYSIDKMEKYGSMVGGNDYLMAALKNTDSFLNDRGFNIFTGLSASDYFSFNKLVDKITFIFDSKYRLQEMEVYARGCGDKPLRYKGRRLDPLRNTQVFKDPTAMGYFVHLNEMTDAIQARQPPSWSDFVTKYTYPAAEEKKEWPETTEGTAGNCIRDALQNEFKQLGVDILDKTFSIADAVSYRYVKNMCMTSNEEKADLDAKVGLIYDPDKREESDIKAFSVTQAFKELAGEDQPFTSLCAAMELDSGALGGDPDFLKEVWNQAFGDLKLCGVNNATSEAVSCLLGSMTFEQFLASSIKMAIKEMSLENFGELLVGLPPDKQQEIEERIVQNLQSGEVPGVDVDQISSVIENGVPQPWNDEAVIVAERSLPEDGGTGEDPIVAAASNERRTLLQQFDIASQADQIFDKNTLMGLYATSLVETLQDNLLDMVVPLLDKFPGPAIITKAFLNPKCPRPPLIEPNGLEFMNNALNPSLCKKKDDFSLPQFTNPFGNWLLPWKDWGAISLDASTFLAQQLLVALIQTTMERLCKIVGDAACKALQTAGTVAASLAAGDNASDMAQLIRDQVCGDNASDDQVMDTIEDLFSKLGPGAAALSDGNTVSDFLDDQASALTRRELLSGCMGEMSEDAVRIIDNLIEYEYPQFREGLPNRQAIRDFYKNVGNLFPAAGRDEIKDFLNELPDNDVLPANPSLCATPEDLEDYCNLRIALLEGRATENQARQMCEDNNTSPQDLEDLLSPPQVPPLFSDPGCDNGVFPFESENQKIATSAALGSQLKQLKVDFAKDMLGNGPFWGDWGMINMVLSDTMGRALSTHNRLVSNSPSKVDFITDSSLPEEMESLAIAENPKLIFLPWMWFASDPSPTDKQFHNYPTSVAEWLRDQMNSMQINFAGSNAPAGPSTTSSSYSNLGFEELYGRDVNLLGLPDYGYNIKYWTTYVNSKPWLVISRLARKETPDITLEFRDNYSGRGSGSGSIPSDEGKFGVGYDCELYLSDMKFNSETGLYCNVGRPNAPADATRVRIIELTNDEPGVEYSPSSTQMFTVEQVEEQPSAEQSILEEQIFEFLSEDDTLIAITENMEEYPKFAFCFENETEYSPQVVLLDEILEKNDSSPGKASLKQFHDSVMSELFSTLKTEIVNNDDAWAFGAKFDSLTPSDADYVVDDDQTDSPGGTLYSKATINGKKLTNQDSILGLSRDQYNNKDNPENIRVFYLDPTTYGGKYTSPAIYVKPLQNEGWLGMAEVLFPETSPCKPSKEDLVNFNDIEESMSTSYQSMPFDERLSAPKDCVLELPYNRILERASAAGIHGIIQAACRMYSTVHFLKSQAVFTRFYPKFPQSYSSIYAQYVVENMEQSLKDAQNGFFEFFNPFKDEEFWYAFLEQSVQYYNYLSNSGAIKKPPKSVIAAATRLNDMTEEYEYPSSSLFWDLKWSAQIPLTQTLNGFREEKNYEAVQATEEDAKLILKELVMMELNAMGERFVENLKTQGRSPAYSNMGYYVLTNLTQGGIDLDLHKEIQKEYIDLPTSGSALYTAGDEFSVPTTGEMYTGYYHVHEDDAGDVVYMAGEYHTDESHNAITPIANKLSVPIGDISELNQVSTTNDISRPFMIEKYISINGTKYSTSDAFEKIRADNPHSINLADAYPGTMEAVMEIDETTGEERQVGITGQMGVRYGLRFSISINGSKNTVTTVEIDALDLPISEFQKLDANTELLFCLINHLVEDDMFRLYYEYLFPVTKTLSMLTIYTDLGFFASIGEKTAASGVGKPRWSTSIIERTFKANDTGKYDFSGSDVSVTTAQIPGAKVSFPYANSGDYTPDYSDSSEGWASYYDRKDSAIFGLFTVTWDEWDKVILNNSKSRLKKIFKTYYFSRNFDPKFDMSSPDPGLRMIKNLKSALFPSPALDVVPWWKRRRIRSNPFDANGNKCKK